MLVTLREHIRVAIEAALKQQVGLRGPCRSVPPVLASRRKLEREIQKAIEGLLNLLEPCGPTPSVTTVSLTDVPPWEADASGEDTSDGGLADANHDVLDRRRLMEHLQAWQRMLDALSNEPGRLVGAPRS